MLAARNAIRSAERADDSSHRVNLGRFDAPQATRTPTGSHDIGRRARPAGRTRYGDDEQPDACHREVPASVWSTGRSDRSTVLEHCAEVERRQRIVAARARKVEQGASFRRLSACGRPKLLSAQIRMSGCLSAYGVG